MIAKEYEPSEILVQSSFVKLPEKFNVNEQVSSFTMEIKNRQNKSKAKTKHFLTRHVNFNRKYSITGIIDQNSRKRAGLADQ